MKRLEQVKKLTTFLLVLSILFAVIFTIFFKGGAVLISGIIYGWDISSEYIFPGFISLISIIQCINLSILLSVITILDKYYAPLY